MIYFYSEIGYWDDENTGLYELESNPNVIFEITV